MTNIEALSSLSDSQLVEHYGEEADSFLTAGDDFHIDASGDNVVINGVSSSEDISINQVSEGVYSSQGNDGECKVFITEAAGDVDVTAEFLEGLFGADYDSNKVEIVLDQDNLVEATDVGKVSISTDVGSVIVDNDNDFSKITEGNTNVAKVDLSIEGQDDDIVVTQRIDVNTLGWSSAGNGEQNIGSNVNYDFNGVSNVELNGHINNTFTTTTEGAENLMAGNEVNINMNNVGSISDSTEMKNDFRVGDEIESQSIPDDVYTWLEERDIDVESIKIVDGEAEGITNVNHFAHGNNGGDGVVVTDMADGSWVISGNGVPQTYTFKPEAEDGEDPAITDPFNIANYNSEVKEGSSIEVTEINVEQLKQNATGSVYGIDGYRIENSVNTSGKVSEIESGPQQSINVTGIDYSLTTDSGNFINGTENSNAVREEEHSSTVTKNSDIQLGKPSVSSFNVNFFSFVSKTFFNEDESWEGTDDEFRTELKSQLDADPDVAKLGLTSDIVMDELASIVGKDKEDLTLYDLQINDSINSVEQGVDEIKLLLEDEDANRDKLNAVTKLLENNGLLEEVSVELEKDGITLVAVGVETEEDTSDATTTDADATTTDA